MWIKGPSYGLRQSLGAAMILVAVTASGASAQSRWCFPRPWCQPYPSLVTETPSKEPPIPIPETPAPAPALPSFTTAALATNTFGDTFGGSSIASVPVVVSTPTPCGCGNNVFRNVITPQTFFLANPSKGGTVGRSKVSEDNNPLPRDRVIFNYDYFNNAPLTANGWDVQRFVIGLEKTFLNQMASVEVRLPFANTLDSTLRAGNEETNQELGNLRITLRGLLYNSDNVILGAGLGINLPTGDNVRLFIGDDEFVRLENRGVVLTPFLGALVAPTERLFAQAWVAANFDTNGNPVLVDLGNGLTPVGRLHDHTTLELDLQLGYWLLQNPQARCLRALAPILELHYGTSLQNADVVSRGGFAIGDAANRGDEFNLTAGLIAGLGNNLSLMVGSVVPLRQRDDRSFDFQFGVRLNWFFGPTAADRDNYFRLVGN